MSIRIKLAVFFFLLGALAIKARAQHCAADPFQYPELAEQRERVEAEMAAWLAAHSQMELQARTLLTIPVVVHVVYRTAPQNISQEQIESQFVVLNTDYQAQNVQSLIPEVFQNLIADMEIEFCLATQDPEGAATSGITRTQTIKNDIGLSTDVHYAFQGGADAWDPTRYLNIWVADMGENIVGRASFPGAVPPAEDGVVVDPRYIGTTGLAANSFPYNEGRTVVHEIGHYFNLYHPWGNGSPTCEGDDAVTDTPLTSTDYLGECPQNLEATCGSLDMYTNFMYYTDDACMAQFTPGQKLRVLACLGGPRAGLLEGLGCKPTNANPGSGMELPAFVLHPNPATEFLTLEYRANYANACEVVFMDIRGREVGRIILNAGQSHVWEVPSSLPNGMYLTVATVKEKVWVEKWVLAR